MKNIYSHPVTILRRWMKKFKQTPEGAYKKMKDYTLHLTSNGNELEYVETAVEHISRLEYNIIKGNCINLFIKDNDLFNFLMETEVKIKSDFASFFNIYPFNHSTGEIEVEHNKDEWVNEEFHYSNIVINHKLSTNSILVFFSYHPVINYIEFIISVGEDYDKVFFRFANADKFIHEWNLDHPYKKYLMLFLNLVYYANAFPDKIFDGIPNDLQYTGLNPGKKNYHIEPHEQIIDRSGVTPHFRRGHFRRLDNDYYKNKKGQIVWVTSSLVKGYNAKTVIQ